MDKGNQKDFKYRLLQFVPFLVEYLCKLIKDTINPLKVLKNANFLIKTTHMSLNSQYTVV